MKIIEWEKNISKTFNYEKFTAFEELKSFLSNPESYKDNFDPENVSEEEILNDEFYAAYVFNEHEILKRDAIGFSNSGWTTTIVLVAADRNKNVSGCFVLGLNGFTKNEISNFFKIIFPKNLSK